MQSMTGYGSGRAATSGGGACVVEIQSVNRRQTEAVVNLPRELASLEPSIREIVNARISRGRLVVNVAVQARPGATSTATAVDRAAARAFYHVALALKTELGAAGDITIESILRAPGVLRTGDEPLDPEANWPAIKSALADALDELIAMRAREGQRLGDDLSARLEEMNARLADIRRRQPDATAHYRATLHERLRRAGLEVPIDDDRLAKEIVIFADRCDISEEVTRLESHLAQFGGLLKSDEPVGRTMDFLAQEMSRELNTLGAKANDLAINQLAVVCKTELDKVREQVQNIE